MEWCQAMASSYCAPNMRTVGQRNKPISCASQHTVHVCSFRRRWGRRASIGEFCQRMLCCTAKSERDAISIPPRYCRILASSIYRRYNLSAVIALMEDGDLDPVIVSSCMFVENETAEICVKSIIETVSHWYFFCSPPVQIYIYIYIYVLVVPINESCRFVYRKR